MNKVVNVFSGIILALYCAFVMAVIYDFSFSSFSVKYVPYKEQICGGLALLILLLGVLRIKRKWQGAADMKNFKRFHFDRPISKSAKNLALLYAIGEGVFMLILMAFLANLMRTSSVYVLPMLLIILALFVEAIIFTFKIYGGGESFRIGIDKKAVAYFNREMHILYFTGLRRIEMHQDMINFQYKEDLNLLLPIELIDKKDRLAFREALIKTIETHVNTNNGKIIYIDDAFRTLE